MATVQRQVGVRPRRWSKQEYYRLGELGFFRGQRAELIEGELMVQSPQGPLHAHEVDRVFRLLDRVFGTGHWVRAQLPLDLGQSSEPEPDVSVVPGSSTNYVQAHPTTVFLIAEVSDTTLNYDRSHKGGLYARAGVTDYWIINLVDRHLEVYRDPVPDPTQPFGHRYSNMDILVPPSTVTPLALPQAIIPVIDLLP